MFELQSPSKSSPSDAIHPLRFFFHCSEQFLNSSILMPFSASAAFCFISSTSAKCFPLRTLLIQGNKKKVPQVEIGWIGRVGHGGHTDFGQELLNTQCCAGRSAHKSAIMKGANALKVFKKISLKPHMASHNTTSCYSDTDGFLAHSPGRGSLYYKGPTFQKTIMGFGGVAPH